MRIITKPQVTGNFLTSPGYDSTPVRGEGQLAVSGVPDLVSVPNTDITNITWGLVSYGLISGIQYRLSGYNLHTCN